MSGRGHHQGTDAIIERYDRDSDRYGHHWAPVLDRTARELLARVGAEARLPSAPAILDVGTGTGVLAFEALTRWPAATVIASDASSGMLRAAKAAAAAAGLAEDPRLRFVHCPADALQADDASVDVVVSSFVLQLVPDRAAAFAEALRVLRPGGALAFVSWLDRDEDFQPSFEFDEAVVDVEIDEGDMPDADEHRSGDFPSASSAARELRAAGFKKMAARPDVLRFTWTPDAYLAFKRDYEEDELFASLSAADAERLIARARERWATMADDAWTWRAEVVSAVAYKPR